MMLVLGEEEREEGKNQLSMFIDNLYNYDHREDDGYFNEIELEEEGEGEVEEGEE